MDFLVKRLFLIALISSVLLSSCISRKTLVPVDQQLLPGLTKTRAELMADLDAQAKKVSTLVAKVELDVSGGGGKTGVLTEYRKTAGIIQVDRPKQVRIQILAPVIATTVADMVSDGREYRVSIPVKNKFGIFDANAPPTSTNALMNLRPQHILDALFVDIRQYEGTAGVKSFLEEATNGRIRYYVLNFVDLSGVDGKLVEKIWIDRTNLEVRRKQMFGAEGRLESDITFAGYIDRDGFAFPQVISIQRPIEDYSVKITFQPDKLRLNEKLAENAFVLERPAGSELVQANNPGAKPF